MQQTNTEEVENCVRLGGKGDPLLIMQKTEFSSYYQMV